MPSIAIFAAVRQLWIMSRKALALPDISRPTSKPSFMPSVLLRVGDRRLLHIQRQVHASSCAPDPAGIR